jgi:hypothetical protein
VVIRFAPYGFLSLPSGILEGHLQGQILPPDLSLYISVSVSFAVTSFLFYFLDVGSNWSIASVPVARSCYYSIDFSTNFNDFVQFCSLILRRICQFAFVKSPRIPFFQSGKRF